MYITQEQIHKYRSVLKDYEDFQNDLYTILKKSNFKMAFFAEALEMKRTTFYSKRKAKSFTVKEYLFLMELLLSGTP